MEKRYTYLVAGLPELFLSFEPTEQSTGLKNFDYEKILSDIYVCIDKEDTKHLRFFLLGLENPTSFFYHRAAKSKNRFTREYFSLDATLRNIQAGVVARQSGEAPDPFLVGDNMVTEAIKTNSAEHDFGLSPEGEDMERIIAILETPGILEREQKIDLFRWEKVNDMTLFHYFDTDAVLAFVVKAFLVDRWIALDRERGAAMFAQLLKECRGVSELIKMPE